MNLKNSKQRENFKYRSKCASVCFSPCKLIILDDAEVQNGPSVWSLLH
jgi:hypothetical protein